MRFGSVCSGIEAASVAWNPLGWEAAWLSEIEPFPSAVLAHHYPGIPNLGDMTTLPERILSGEVEAPDLFCGGTPCQAFSVAGLRQSLGDARGNLSLTFCEIANAIDRVRSVRGEPASIVFWENVPGVLSTKDNAFGCFLAQLCGGSEPLIAPNGWTNAGCVSGPKRTVAWRVLDAQYFGLAQRRRRVFVVASARNDFDPAAVLFEFDGLRRDIAPSRETRQGIAGGIEIGPSGGRLTDLNPTLDTRAKDDPIRNQLAGAVITMAHGQGGAEIASERSPTLTCNHEAPIAAYSTKLHNTASNQAGKVYEEYATSLNANSPASAVFQPIGVTIHGTDPTVQKVASYDELAQCLRARTPGNIDNSSTTVVQQPIAFSAKDHGADATADLSPTLRAMGHAHSHANGGGQMAVMQPMAFQPGNLSRGAGASPSTEVFPTLKSDHGRGKSDQDPHVAVAHISVMPTMVSGGSTEASHNQMSGQFRDEYIVPTPTMAVRRLTPVECERLQGFPDNYSQIPWRKKPANECPDGPRYKALGNSWAVPVVRWIGSRINESMK
jgi:DNA (cytosine-5)-methyltransferase 1